MAKSKRKIGGVVAAVGAAAAAAAVGAYWFYGTKNAKAHRKTARSWMLKARGDVLAAVETAVKKAGEIDKATYMKIVDGVLKRYSKSAGVTAAEMRQVTSDMKAAWQHMQKIHKRGVKKTKKS